MSTSTFIDNDIIPDASTSVKFQEMTYDEMYFYVILEYNNATYVGIGSATTFQTQKIRKAIKNKIYEGEIELKYSSPIIVYEIENFTEKINYKRQYRLDVIVNGEEKSLYTASTATLNGLGVRVKISDDVFVFLNNIQIIILPLNNGTWESDNPVIIKGIYEVGESNNYVEDENGFGALYHNINNENITRWELCMTPEKDYIIPKKVKDHLIEAVAIDAIGENPTFTFSTKLTYVGDFICGPSSIKVTTPDIDFLFEGCLNYDKTTTSSHLDELDLSECGDSINIPTEFITGHTDTKIYVSSKVKENYAQYSNVIAK